MLSPPDFGTNIIKYDLHVCCPYTAQSVCWHRFWSLAPINLGLWRWWRRKVVMVANLYESMQSRGCQECCQYRQGLLTALANIHGVDMDYGVLHITYQSLKKIFWMCVYINGCWSHYESYGCWLYTLWMPRMLTVYIWMLWMPSAHIMDVMSVIGRHVKNVSVHTGTKDL